jgi:hypothetical protein
VRAVQGPNVHSKSAPKPAPPENGTGSLFCSDNLLDLFLFLDYAL